MNRKIATGQTHGSLKVLRRVADYVSPSGKRLSQWGCLCVCGEVVIKKTNALHDRSKCSPTCGVDGNAMDHPLYGIWRGAINRCTQPNSPSWSSYGGRGIAVCDEWRNSFVQFVADMGDRPTTKHQIERYDNDGPYAPWNCGWELPKAQAYNRRSTRRILINGQEMSTLEIAATAGVPVSTVASRIKRGWTGEELLKPFGSKRIE